MQSFAPALDSKDNAKAKESKDSSKTNESSKDTSSTKDAPASSKDSSKDAAKATKASSDSSSSSGTAKDGSDAAKPAATPTKPPFTPAKEEVDQYGLRINARLNRWTYPFQFAPINSRVVRRSNALWPEPYGERFVYSEAHEAEGPVDAILGAMGHSCVHLVTTVPLLRRVVAPLLPKPGDGPPEAFRKKNHWKFTLYGWTQEEGRRKGIQCQVRLPVLCCMSFYRSLCKGSLSTGPVVTDVVNKYLQTRLAPQRCREIGRCMQVHCSRGRWQEYISWGTRVCTS